MTRWPVRFASTHARCDVVSRTNRFYSAAAHSQRPTSLPKETKENDSRKKVYEYSVNLPRTSFPMRANAVQNEIHYRQRCTDFLYQWQQKHLKDDYILHDGPPYANGRLHIGHALNKILKDIINRFQILQRRRVHYVPGWDCHGLPIEFKVISDYNKKRPVNERQPLEPLTIRRIAKTAALEAIEAQKEQFREWAILGDWDHSYKTLDPAYEAHQLEVFRKMAQNGLIYRSFKPVYWSPSTRTALAEAELEYRDDHCSPSVYVRFPLQMQDTENTYGLIWTTTPWTLPANKAITVNANMVYSVVKNGESGKSYVLAKNRLPELEKLFPQQAFDVVQEMTGEEFAKRATYINPLSGLVNPIITADFVTADAGTGLVHTAPGHGFDDYLVCKKSSIAPYCPVDDAGRFTEEAGSELAGKDIFKDGSSTVISLLQQSNAVVFQEPYKHKYPYDWRSKKPVIIRATKQWFADLSRIKTDALNALNRVQILPESGRRRLESFVATRSEWCISRQRTWGVPIPVFYDEETGDVLLNNETMKHVTELIAKRGSDCWWQLDTSELLPEKFRNNGRKYVKGTDTMDVWFDSGVSWMGLKDVADVYLEGSDQHRGWFQSSLLTSVAIRKEAPYKTLLTHGFVMDEQGRKMSKSLGNVIEPSFVTQDGMGSNKKRNLGYGSDALRWWVGSTNYTQDVAIGTNVLKQTAESLRKVRNTARFMLANLHKFTSKHLLNYSDMCEIDKIALSDMKLFTNQCKQGYAHFDFQQVHQSILNYAGNDLSSFYFEIVKDRLYNESKSSRNRLSAQSTLFYILQNYTLAIAPMVPHLAEEIFEHMKPMLDTPAISVFQMGWPDVEPIKELKTDSTNLKQLCKVVKVALEVLRERKEIGNSTDAEVVLEADEVVLPVLENFRPLLEEVFVVSAADVKPLDTKLSESRVRVELQGEDCTGIEGLVSIKAKRSERHKCARCFKLTSSSEGGLCGRCEQVVSTMNQI